MRTSIFKIMTIKKTGFLAITFAVLSAFGHDCFSQVGLFPIEPQRVQVAFDKTVSLVFPGNIKSVDKGTRDLLVQKAKGVENILQIKAARTGFSPTNLTVVTTEAFYSFSVSYSSEPVLALKVMNNGRVADALFTGQVDEWETESTAVWISKICEPVRIKRESQYGIFLELTGVFISKDVLYYCIRVGNRTPIGYDIAGLRFFVRDKRKVRRGAIQETELIPVYVHGNTHKVEGNSENALVFALPKHTLPEKKYLTVDLSETQNGGRELQLKLRYKTLTRAVPFTRPIE